MGIGHVLGIIVALLFGGLCVALLLAERNAPFSKVKEIFYKSVIPMLIGAAGTGGVTYALQVAKKTGVQVVDVMAGYVLMSLPSVAVSVYLVLRNAMRWGDLTEEEKLAIDLRITKKKNEKDAAREMGLTVDAFRAIYRTALEKQKPRNGRV
jgi:hypothetical protein